MSASPRIFVTNHPSDIFHDPKLAEVVKSDWVRIKNYLSGSYPQPLPEIVEWKWIGTDGDDLYDLYKNAPYVVIDTEYNPMTSWMWLLGMGAPGLPILQWWPNNASSMNISCVRQSLLELIKKVPVVFQNSFADIPVIEKALGIKYSDYLKIDDTMLLHSLLWCELPHSLEFAASIYGRHEKLKHLATTDPRYNAGDVAETISFWEGVSNEARRDRETQLIYEHYLLPLVPIILESQSLGIRVDRGQVEKARSEFQHRLGLAVKVAQAYCGFPINLGSPKQLLSFLSYDLNKKLKSVDEDTIAKLRGAVLPFDPQAEPTFELGMERIHEGGHPLLEMRVVYARAQQYLSHYIEPMMANEDGRVYPHFHPWAQNTGRWSTVEAKVDNKPIPNHRGIPAAQLPHELRDALISDEGWAWVEFDYEQIELRLIAALAKDKPLLEWFSQDWDVHTLNMCDFLGYPYPPLKDKHGINTAGESAEWREIVKWQGGDDDRRILTKALVFRLCYGGDPRHATDVPGVARLGLNGADLVISSNRWQRKHPAIKQFWNRIKRNSLQTRQVRTFLGRRWNFLSHDMRRILRQMYNFPMQGGVADIKNGTLIAIKRELGDRVRLSYEMHDSLKLQVKITESLEEDIHTIQHLAEQIWNVYGVDVRFPVEMKRRHQCSQR